jgi:extracellular matrix regulatory protein A
MQTVHIGFDNYLIIDNISVLISYDGLAIRRKTRPMRDSGQIMDLCRGRRAKCLVITKTGPWLLSALNPVTIAGRIDDGS